MLATQTGREFADAETALAYIRECQEKMLDPNVSMMASHAATIEMVYTFKALDDYLQDNGVLPIGWARAARPGVRAHNSNGD